MKKSKKLVALCCAIIMTFSSSVSTFATTHSNADTNPALVQSFEGKNIGGSEINPRETVKPTDPWNVVTQGRYNFAGASHIQTMYTNYYFVGAYNYYVLVTNNSISKNLRVRVLSLTSNTVYRDFVVPPETTYSYPIYGTNPISTHLYIEFTGTNQLFEGYIRQY